MLGLFIFTCILIAPLYLVYKPPAYLVRYFQWRWPDVLWCVSTSSKVVALTIDDGPSDYTNEIMQILKSNAATATFFVIGSQIAGHEKILQDMIRNGNELGNHAMRDEPSRSLSDATFVEQIHSVEGSLHEAYAAIDAEPPPKYFRPGSGFSAKGCVRCWTDWATGWSLVAYTLMIRRFLFGVSMPPIY